MEFLVLKDKDVEEEADEIVDFYQPLYMIDRDYYKKAVNNSGLICLAKDKDKIIGSCRVLTDFAKHAYICDFIIQPEYRGQGLGKELIAFAGAECKKLGCKYIGLTCAPELISFYKKASFGPEDGFQYMKYQE